MIRESYDIKTRTWKEDRPLCCKGCGSAKGPFDSAGHCEPCNDAWRITAEDDERLAAEYDQGELS